MAEEDRIGAVETFYDTHPINETQILDKLTADGHDPAAISEDILQNYDQDHFGGIAVNDVLAERAGIDADSHVLDVCCGMGGPARYLAHNYGCRVTGIDMTQSRIDGARRLTAMAGLADQVTFECGNALDLPFEAASFDVIVSQEAFCHIPDKAQLVAELVRVTRSGGRVAFTDILARDAMTPEIAERLAREMTFNDLGTAASYRALFSDHGCDLIHLDDLSEDWRVILIDRLAMYRSLEDQTVAKFGRARFAEWDAAYSHFVGLFGTGELGGGRFVFQKR